MAEKKDLTPEEKLLNVIQGKERDVKPAAEAAKPQPAAAQAPVAKPVEAVPAPTTPPGPKGRPAGEGLKLAPSAQAAPAPSPRPAPASAAVASAATPVTAQPDGKVADGSPKTDPKPAQPPVRANLKSAGANRIDVRSRTLAVVNRILRVVIVAMVGLCVWEVWANCSIEAMPGNPQLGSAASVATAPLSLESCSSLLASFEGKTLFVPIVAQEPEQTVTNVVKTSLSEVQQYVTRNLNLIGVSPGADGSFREAILTDVQTKRNYFLKVGDKIAMKNWAIELKSVAADHAVFLCGKEEIQVQ